MKENFLPKINYKILNKTNNFILLKIKHEMNNSSGLAITVGNALRRIMLNNIMGTAVTSLIISSPASTDLFSENFKEDLFEIFANIKELSLRSNKLKKSCAYLNIQGPAVVTASDLILPEHITVANPHHYLFTIVKDMQINMEFQLEQGFGYKLYNENYEALSLKDNKFLIDANFAPVKKVNYKVVLEESEVKPGTLVETLFLEIWTNGSISPLRAFFEACKTISLLFSTFLF